MLFPVIWWCLNLKIFQDFATGPHRPLFAILASVHYDCFKFLEKKILPKMISIK